MEDETTTTPPRRSTKDERSSRLAALEQLKKMKRRGEKNKYEPETTYEPVYDIVDEDEYVERVKQRQDDDWVVADGFLGGNGYIDDGREIFDDDFCDNDEIKQKTAKDKAKNSYKSSNPNVFNPEKKKNRDLKSFFDNSAPKKEVSCTVDDEELMKEAMSQFEYGPSKINKSSSSLSNLTYVKSTAAKFNVEMTKILSAGPPVNPFSKNASKRLPMDSPSKIISPNKLPPQKQYKQSFSPFKSTERENLAGNDVIIGEHDVIDRENSSKRVQKQLIDKFDDDPIGRSGHVTSVAPRNSDLSETTTKNHQVSDNVSIIDLNNFTDDFSDDSMLVENPSETNLHINKIAEQLFSPETPEKFANIIRVTDNKDNDDVIFKEEPVDTDPDYTGGESSRLNFYLLDAYEDTLKTPGTVYLFGRILDKSKRSYQSCSIIVKNIERRLLILPREQRMDIRTGQPYGDTLEMADIYNEVKRFTEKYHIPKTRTKTIKKKYGVVGSLTVDAPYEADYLELRYGFNFPCLPADLVGETFSAIFGVSSSALELFLLERNIKGPRWLEITDAVKCESSPTWCQAFVVNKPSNVSTTSNATIAPPVRAVILKLKTMPDRKNQHEIVCATLWANNSFEFDKDNSANWERMCFVTKPSDCALPLYFKEKVQNLDKNRLPSVEIVVNERALLNILLAKIQKFDPDVIIGHDLWNFELDTLIQRMAAYKIALWSRLGRLRRNGALKAVSHKSFIYDVTAGRLVCDIAVMARELIKAKNYDLSGLVSHVLKKDREEILPETVKLMFNSADCLFHLLSLVNTDLSYILSICSALKCLPLAAEITRIVGGILSKTLMGGRSERTEYLLLHALEYAGYIFPEKFSHGRHRKAGKDFVVKEEDENEEMDHTVTLNNKKAAYVGGLVLEPKKGLYDQMILLLDFNSLYPSIMQEFNICFTTINLYAFKKEQVTNSNDSLPNPPGSTTELGILPSEIRKLVESRRAVKQLMKDSNISQELRQQYAIRQEALKITANSMYGCLGFNSSRFCAKPLAALITSKGREILMDTKELVESSGLEVIYGDTDSIMINTNRFDLDEVLTLAKKLKTDVNKKYSLLELDIDGIFKKLLLLKKKKYAGLLIDRSQDGKISYVKQVKGLDIIRRDWSVISIESGDFVLNEILSEHGLDEIMENIQQYLTRLSTELRDQQILNEKFVIKKQLTKSPNDYGDKKSLPHVIVALRLNNKGRKFKQGDVVSYVICEDGTSNSAPQRAYELSELPENSNLKIDVNYYLSQQIHPVVARLCEPIEGLDSARIAECLGLDPNSYKHRSNATALSSNTNEDDWSTLFTAASDSSSCSSFDFTCPNPDCNALCEIRSTFIGKGFEMNLSLAKCSNEKCTNPPFAHSHLLVNRLRLLIRRIIDTYYSNWMMCEDITCAHRTRKVPFKIHNGQIVCPSCGKNYLKQELSEKMLFDQLSFFERIFDLNTALSGLSREEHENLRNIIKEATDLYKQLHDVAQYYLQRNGYSQVDLHKLFSCLKT